MENNEKGVLGGGVGGGVNMHLAEISLMVFQFT